MDTRPSRRWHATAIAVAVLLIAAAPGMGHIVVALRDAARTRYAVVLTVIVATAVLVILAGAAVVVRDRRLARFGWIAGAFIVAAGYAWGTRSGVVDADAAERFHFVQYGVLAFLFYKAWRPLGDGGTLWLPVLACVLVGTVDEWVQWFVPGRVGEAKDVLLNVFAGAAGLLLAIGIHPPIRLTLHLSPESRRHVARVGAVLIVVFAGFFQAVHFAHQIAEGTAVFYSRYSAERLLAISAARAERWQTSPPVTWRRYSREDQYLTEGIAHIRRRNQQWDEGHLRAARQENLILEKYYAPVLDTPSYVSAAPHRWSADQRAHADQLPGPGFMIYESDALDYLVVTWRPLFYWLAVLAAILLLLRRMS